MEKTIGEEHEGGQAPRDGVSKAKHGGGRGETDEDERIRHPSEPSAERTTAKTSGCSATVYGPTQGDRPCTSGCGPVVTL